MAAKRETAPAEDDSEPARQKRKMAGLDAGAARAAIPLSRHSSYELDGVANFRQCGGYRTADGRAVKWGKLFRSASMQKPSAADLAKFAELGIKTQLDMEGAVKKVFSPGEDEGARTFTKHEFECGAPEITEEGVRLGAQRHSAPASLREAQHRELGAQGGRRSSRAPTK